MPGRGLLSMMWRISKKGYNVQLLRATDNKSHLFVNQQQFCEEKFTPDGLNENLQQVMTNTEICKPCLNNFRTWQSKLR